MNVQIEVCIGLIKSQLAGYQGFPNTQEGVVRFAKALQGASVSVEHAIAICANFTGKFPTVQEFIDVGLNLRPKFEAPADPVKDWKQQYGESQQFDKYPADELAMHWMAFRDMLYYTEGPGAPDDPAYWARARQFDLDPERGHADTIVFIRRQIAALGWPAIMAMTKSPEAFPYKNLLTLRLPRIPNVSQARKSPADVDSDLDSWADPDR